MADQKISQLTDGGNSQATDEYVVARSGANYRIDGASVAAAATSVGTLTSLTVSGDLTVDTSTLKVDSANNRVGIGTASTDSTLYVVGPGSTGGMRIAYNGTSENYYDADKHTFRGGNGSIVAFATTATGDVAFDTSTLYVDATNNRVGIGTASPTNALSVTTAGTALAAFTGAQYSQIRHSDGTRVLYTQVYDNLAVIGTETSTPLAFNTNSVERLRLDSSGNLGLGVTPSAWTSPFVAQQIGSGIGSLVLAGRTDGGADMFIGRNVYYGGSPTDFRYIGTGTATRYRCDGATHAWSIAASGTAGNAITFTQAMTLDASGNLSLAGGNYVTGNGIVSLTRTTNPTSGIMLDMTNQTTASNNGCKIAFDAYNIGGAAIGIPSTSASLVFYVNGNTTERARITSGGYFKASNDGTYLGSTGVYHELRSSEPTANTFRISNTSADPYGGAIEFPAASPDNNTNWFLLCADSTATRCLIYSDGDVLNHDGVYGTISDERLKQDIVDAGSAWDDLKAVRFRKYRMKSDVEANPDAPAMLGVIAQELEQVMPGLVDEHPEFKEQEVTDEDGNVTTERVQVGSTKTVKSSILLMKAAVALQEAMARIEALEARLEALEA